HVRRTAAAADRAATPVKEGESDATVMEHRRELLLRFVERPTRTEVADVLVRVGIPDHHFLLVADRPERIAIDSLVQQRGHDFRRLVERLTLFKKWNDAKCSSFSADSREL